MCRQIFPQLLVLASVFFANSCGPRVNENPCNCSVAQEYSTNSLNLGSTGSELVTIAQSFTVPTTKAIKKVSIYLSKPTSYNVALRVTVYADNGSQTAPNSGVSLGSSVATLVSTASGSWVNFCFSADCESTTITLNANTRYWIALSRPTSNAVSATDYYVVSTAPNKYSGLVSVINANSLGSWSSVDANNTSVTAHSLTFRLGCDLTGDGCD